MRLMNRSKARLLNALIMHANICNDVSSAMENNGMLQLSGVATEAPRSLQACQGSFSVQETQSWSDGPLHESK